jgi:hypothetical protein
MVYLAVVLLNRNSSGVEIVGGCFVLHHRIPEPIANQLLVHNIWNRLSNCFSFVSVVSFVIITTTLNFKRTLVDNTLPFGLWFTTLCLLDCGLQHSAFWTLVYNTLPFGLWFTTICLLDFGLQHSAFWTLVYNTLPFGLWFTTLCLLDFGLQHSAFLVDHTLPSDFG